MGRAADAGPYGGAGAVLPFLGDADNGRLLDPYREIARVLVLQQLKASLLRGIAAGGLSGRELRELRKQLEHQLAVDAANPEVQFLVGLLNQLQATYEHAAGDPGRAAANLEAAEAAFGRAWELGRQDPATLALWVGVNGVGHEPRALERLAAWMPKQRPDCQLQVLKARLHVALGQVQEAAEACEKARSLCRTAKQKAAMTETCR